MCDKHRDTEEPCEAKVSRTVLESGGSREGVADFNTKCGHVHCKLGGNKNFKCPHCGYEIPRDFNGALGIFLKALWDTTFLSEISEQNVVLDVEVCLRCRG